MFLLIIEKRRFSKIFHLYLKREKYALIGPSGCGKSTFLKILLGWLPDYTGNIYFDDTDIRIVAPEQIQQQIGYVDQNVFLFNTTIRENITLGGRFTEEQIKKRLKIVHLSTIYLLCQMGWTRLLEKTGIRYLEAKSKELRLLVH